MKLHFYIEDPGDSNGAFFDGNGISLWADWGAGMGHARLIERELEGWYEGWYGHMGYASGTEGYPYGDGPIDVFSHQTSRS